MISSNFFEKLTFSFNIEKLQEEVNLIRQEQGYNKEQISLVYREGHKHDCWIDGTGSPFRFDENRKPLLNENGEITRRFYEEEFKKINPGLENTELEVVYNKLKEIYNITRVRIAKISPKSCYGWHKDEEIRIHLPIFTAPGCFIITDDGVASHLPANGSAYMFHARNGYHTAINSDYKLERIHLLFNVW